MNKEIIIRRADKSRIKIIPNVYLDRNKPVYRVEVHECEKNKRTFKNVVDKDSWDRRNLDMKDRPKHDTKEQLKHVTYNEIYQAKLSLWNDLKP